MLRGCLVLPSRSSSAARSGSTRRSVARRPRPTAGRRGKGRQALGGAAHARRQADLQGNWTNEARRRSSAWAPPKGTLTEEQANAIESAHWTSKSSAIARAIPTARRRRGGEKGRLAAPGQQSFIEIIAEAAGGTVGGYNGFWLEPGLNVIRIDGVAQLDHHRPAERPGAAADRRRRSVSPKSRRGAKRSSASSIIPRCGRSRIAA